MTTGLERIAAKARQEPRLRFTTLAHHLTKELVWESLMHIPNSSAAGVDGQSVESAKETFNDWVGETLDSIHRQGYRPPPVRRVYVPKPGKLERRPLGVPCQADKAIQRSVSQARLKLSACAEEIDYRHQRGLEKRRMVTLLTCDWIRNRRSTRYEAK